MNINFSKNGGLIPCVVQDARTQVVLMLAYMNEEASLVVRDGANGLEGDFSYDDFDGFWIQQPMKCGAVNYF